MMSPSPPFIDLDEGALDYSQIRSEALPLAGLIALFAGLALIPFIFVFLFAGNSALGLLFTVVGQVILAIGAGIVLMYVIARGIQLSGKYELEIDFSNSPFRTGERFLHDRIAQNKPTVYSPFGS